MYWILFVMGAMAAVVIAMLVGGLTTPRAHVVVRSAAIAAPATTVWEVIRDVARQADWREVLEEITVDDSADAVLRWTARSMTASQRFEATVDEPPTRFGARSLDSDHSATSEWSWEVQARGDGCLVVAMERGEVENPIVRFVRTHLIGFARPVEHYLRDLGRAVGDADIEIVEGTATE